MWTFTPVLLALLPTLVSSETVLGVYIFHRHGDRTAKSTPPTSLTDLGYQQVLDAGNYFRGRYLNTSAPLHIAGINSTSVKLSQVSFSAPTDNVLQNSAQGFTQGLYPPVGGAAAAQTLRNGSTMQAPMNGYQLIPIGTVSSGAGSEDSQWLQDTTSCGNAEASSNQYFYSNEYNMLKDQTTGFYQGLSPVINSTFAASQQSYKNAYNIFDYINVASIHNTSYPDSGAITPETLSTLQSLAATHEYALAYNASSTIRGIAGAQLAAQVVDYLNSTMAHPPSSTSGPKLGVQFGAYGTFQSYFGLAGLSELSGDPGVMFQQIPDYASAAAWELYTNSSSNTSTTTVDPSQVFVRFLFHNGTTTSDADLVPYPLFGSNNVDMSWNDFVSGSNAFSVGTTEKWCQVCGNSTGSCAEYAGSANGGPPPRASNKSGSGISNAVAGVIGAMVTLGVIFLVEALVLLVGGLRLVRKRKGAGQMTNGAVAADGVKA